jgi:PAS domain S-box-containing protein
MVVEDSGLRDLAEENERLRAKIAGLEQQLSEARVRVSQTAPAPSGDGLGGAQGSAGSPAERALDAFFEQSLAMMFVADLVEGRFLRINRKVCDVIGCSEKEILESSFLDRVHPDDHLRTMREMERLVAGEHTTNFRNRHRDANGDYRIFDWTAVADENGELCYAMAVEVSEL